MIMREWRGRAAPDRAEAYPRHFRTVVLPELGHIPGFMGAHLIRRPHNDGFEFVVLTRWQSLDSIRAFTGEDIGKAVVEPGAVAALLDFDDRVQHYDVIEAVQTEAG